MKKCCQKDLSHTFTSSGHKSDCTPVDMFRNVSGGWRGDQFKAKARCFSNPNHVVLVPQPNTRAFKQCCDKRDAEIQRKDATKTNVQFNLSAVLVPCCSSVAPEEIQEFQIFCSVASQLMWLHFDHLV